MESMADVREVESMADVREVEPWWTSGQAGGAAAPERLRPPPCLRYARVIRVVRVARFGQSTRTAPVGGSYDSGCSPTPLDGFCAPTNIPSPTYTATWYALPALPQ